MQQFHKHISLVAVSVFSLSILAVVPVSAQTTSPVEGENSSQNREAAEARKQEALKNANDAAKQRANDRAAITKVTSGDTVAAAAESNELKAQAKKLVQDQKRSGKEKSAEAKMKACEARMDSINRQQGNYAKAGERHLEVFDNIYDKVEAFQADKNLTVENYDALKAAVETKRADAVDAVEILKALPEFACDNEEPAEAVAALKLAVSNTKTALNDYRTAIKDLVKTLKKAGLEQPSKIEQEVN